ncbi:holo-ACP synthase [Vibrio fortis]|jgi:holo-[acyl-carrier protein] synthase|uniref:Holo-[acyl-carrier-protein] synthase n=1 Tax=Vibrio fortis TaxID=212667 RepID=A0A066URP9_9VIBR|nr:MULTISPECIES: holo-ACP synthase [Vibrio]KAB0302752.1 holo-ACP synthase [Vibrio fortis]KDN29715.1 ACP synthase [Vibrio fortis]MCG9631487.1 holo-ACP synthase [Vibrio sp. Isolate30]MDK9764456.1 holo-ACP synthase [Vibrio sp. D420a]QFT10799.1 Holo-[acyl-carrier-protein] synthase [Vibrio sp. THAF190c]
MAVVGLGTDIAEIERVEKALARSGAAFAERILSEVELEQFHSLKQKGRFLAKRFAAKEAASKALGTGIAMGVTFHDFQVANDEHGKPVLTLHNKAKELAASIGVNSIHITISDERHYAVATVLFES